MFGLEIGAAMAILATYQQQAEMAARHTQAALPGAYLGAFAKARAPCGYCGMSARDDDGRCSSCGAPSPRGLKP